jgi:hypothetical protein
VRKFFVSLAVILLTRHAQAGTVWIDTDVSIGSPIREVDDAFALVLAFHSPEIRIAGLSTTSAAPNERHAASSILHRLRAGDEAFRHAKTRNAAKPRITRKGGVETPKAFASRLAAP